MPIHIITKKPNNYFSKEFIKLIARYLLSKKRGPQAVILSLTHGLEELGTNYKLNSSINSSDIFYVNESISALRWAIKLKREGKIAKLIAGPNLVVAPDEFDSIACAEEIDLYLLPSEWVRNWWLSLRPELAGRLKVWAAGAKDNGISDIKKDQILVYRKKIKNEVFQTVINKLNEKKVKFEVLNYGGFVQGQYFEKLDRSHVLIYLQESESQGIALLEAWAKDVPTFVWNNKTYKYKNYFWTDEKISAPYLSTESGAFFNNEDELVSLIDGLSSGTSYAPRNYYLQNFTDKICAQKFLELISK